MLKTDNYIDDFNKIVKKYENYLIRKSTEITGDIELSKEIIQETFLAFNNKFKLLEDRSNILAYLFTIAKNKSIDTIRKLQKKNDYIKSQNIKEETHSDFTKNSLLKIDLETALKKIPEKFSTPLILADYENLDYKEISKKLSIPINTVRSRIFRAREKLSKILQDMGVNYENL